MLKRGDVVQSRSAVGIVWRIEGERVHYLPVVRGGAARHRAHVAISDGWAVTGVTLRNAVVECHRQHNGRVASFTHTGALPVEALGEVIQAVAREHNSRATEDRLHYVRRITLASILPT